MIATAPEKPAATGPTLEALLEWQWRAVLYPGNGTSKLWMRWVCLIEDLAAEIADPFGAPVSRNGDDDEFGIEPGRLPDDIFDAVKPIALAWAATEIRKRADAGKHVELPEGVTL